MADPGAPLPADSWRDPTLIGDGSSDPWWNPASGYQQGNTMFPGSNIDQRIGEISSIYGDYADRLTGAQVNFDPYRAQYNQYYGTPSSAYPQGGAQYGGGWNVTPATGQYGAIEQALADAGMFFGNQQDRYGTYYDDRLVRSQDVAGQFADLSMGVMNPETQQREGGFYNQQYFNALNNAGALQDLALGAVGPDGQRVGGFYNQQYTNAMGNADLLRNLAQGYYDDTGQWIPGFFANQFGASTDAAGGLRDLLTGQIDQNTGMAMGGLYGTQFTMDTALNEALYGAEGTSRQLLGDLYGTYDEDLGAYTGGTSRGLVEDLYGTSTGLMEDLYGSYDAESGQYTGGTQRQMMEDLYGETGASRVLADTIYDRAAGILGEGETRTGGFYADQANTAVATANAAYDAAAAPLQTTTETRPVTDANGEPVMEEVTTWEPMHEADGTPILDVNGNAVTEPVTSMQQTTEELVSYQGGFYSVQEANQIQRAEMQRAQAQVHAANVKREQVRVANDLFDRSKEFFTTERDAALAMVQAMEGAAGAGGARGRYAQQTGFFDAQETRGISELARQIGVINAENLRRGGRVSEYETLMAGLPDPVTGQRTQTGALGGRIGEAEQAMLERIGGLQAGAAQEMGTVRASEEQRLADLRTGYGEDVSGAVAALQAQGIDPTQLQAMTAQTGALLGAQEASQLAMLDRLQRAEGMLGSEQTLAAQQMADEATRALENQLFSARTGIEEDIYGRLEGVQQREFGVREGARTGEFTAGQTLSEALDALSRERYGYGAEARRGVFGAGQQQAQALSSADLGWLQREFDAMQREGTAVGAAQDTARAGIFGSSQQQAAAVANANAQQRAGLFQAGNVYDTALGQAQANLTSGLGGVNENLLRGLGQADIDRLRGLGLVDENLLRGMGAVDENMLRGTAGAQSGLLAGTTNAQVAYQAALAQAAQAQNLGMYQSNVGWQQSAANALAAQNLGGFQASSVYQQAQADALSNLQQGQFTSQQGYDQSMYDALEAQLGGQFQAGEDAAAGLFGAGQEADAQQRAVEESRFQADMNLAMQESTQAAGLQGTLAQNQLTRDLAIAEAEEAAAGGVPVTQSWMTPGSATQEALSALGYTPDQVANFDNTTLRGLVNQYWDEVDYAQTHVTTSLPWQGDVLYNQATGEYGSMADYPGAGFPGGAITGLEQAANAGFAPYQEPVTYTDAQYAAGNMPGTFDWEAPSQPLLANVGGMNFNIGTVDAQGNPQISDWRALEMWASAQGNPMPQRDAYQTDEQGYQDSLSLWWAAILPALQTLASP